MYAGLEEGKDEAVPSMLPLVIDSSFKPFIRAKTQEHDQFLLI